MTLGDLDCLYTWRRFNWDADLILHEAGVPPLHTPVPILAALPPDVKQRLYLVHVGISNFSFDEGLRIASCGTKNTLRLDIDPSYHQPSVELFDIIGSLDLFRNLPIVKVGGTRVTRKLSRTGPSKVERACGPPALQVRLTRRG